MNVASSYSVEIRFVGSKMFKETIRIYRNAVAYLIGVCNAEYDYIAGKTGALERKRCLETLIHNTKDNAAK